MYFSSPSAGQITPQTPFALQLLTMLPVVFCAQRHGGQFASIYRAQGRGQVGHSRSGRCLWSPIAAYLAISTKFPQLRLSRIYKVMSSRAFLSGPTTSTHFFIASIWIYQMAQDYLWHVSCATSLPITSHKTPLYTLQPGF